VKTTQPDRLSEDVSPEDHARGSPLAPVTLVGYGDFTNPACSETYRAVQDIRKKMGTRLRYVFRSFSGEAGSGHSCDAAEAAECASSQGKFWEMHDRLFENPESDEFILSRHASELGLDLRLFLREMNAHAHSARLAAVREAGIESGVTSAPTFFINSLRHESAFGIATLLPAVQAAAGGA